MNLDIDRGIKGSANRVLVCSGKKAPKNISSEDKSLVDSFLKSDDDYRIYRSGNEIVFCVKAGDKAENLRNHGATIRKDLPKQADTLAFIGEERYVASILEGLFLASYQFIHYFADAEKRAYKLENILVEEGFSAEIMAELMHTKEAVHWTRDMINEPVSYLNAQQFSEEISAFSRSRGMEVTVLEKSQLEALKMGGILAVNKGSIDPPTMTIVEYKPKKAKNKKPIVLVGKGVVYDTGGLSLKPTANSMDMMKCDMGGGAAVIGAIGLIADQKLPFHVIAIVPATDNRPGLNAYAPGDVIKMYNGKTVEVLNTDAEGRMILADALSYSKKFDPELVIDMATLTGAAHRAVGEHATCIMGNAKKDIFQKIEKAGEECYERTVTFPFWEEYGEEMKSSIADLKNLGGPLAGQITAGKFLEHFVDAPFVHMDIAGPSWLDKDNTYRTKGGSGVGVRLLYHFIKNYA